MSAIYCESIEPKRRTLFSTLWTAGVGRMALRPFGDARDDEPAVWINSSRALGRASVSARDYTWRG